jgi:hypothetical protein
MVEIQKFYEEITQKMELKGRVATHASLLAKRLGRPLSDAEHAVLTERLDRLGEDRIFDLVLTHDGEALAAWLADPDAR